MSNRHRSDIFLPCRTFTVQVRLGEPDGLSQLEELVIRAIGAGVDTPQRLAALFSLPQPMVFDLLFDLWTAGHIYLDPARSRAALTDRVKIALDRGELRSLGGVDRKLEPVTLMQELLTGRILPVAGRKRPGPHGQVVPSLLSGADLARASQQEMHDAVARAVALRSRIEKRPLVVREVWVEQAAPASEEVSSVSGEMRWLPLVVEARQGHADRLEFAILDGAALDPVSARSVEAGLSRAADRLGDLPFFEPFWRNTAPDAPELALSSALAELERAVRGLSGLNPGLVSARHADLTSWLQQAQHALVAHRGTPARAVLVSSKADHEAQIRAVFREAESQIVLVCPFIDPEAMDARPEGDGPDSRSYWSLIEDALSRGVRIFLLWGIDPDETLSVQLQTRRDRLVRGWPRRFVMSTRSARTHAKLVIRDADWMLVSSYNFLHPSAEGTLELGVAVTPPQVGSSSPLIEGALLWARDHLPDYQEAQTLRVVGAPTDEQIAPMELTVTAPAPVPQSLLEDSTLASTAIRGWAQQWAATLRDVQRRLSADGEHGRLVVDAEHRSLLDEALNTARCQVLITSDRLGGDAVTSWMLDAIKGALDRGVRVTLAWRRGDERVLTEEARPERKLRALAERYPGLTLLHRAGGTGKAGNHAKLILFDDRLVVSSFNFLSVSGETGQGGGASRRRDRTEVGILLRGSGLLAPALELLQAWYGIRAEIREPAELQAEAAAADPPAGIFEALAALRSPETDRVGAILRWAESAEAPWRALAVLTEGALNLDAAELAVSAVLARRAVDLDTHEIARWRAWLGARMWSKGRFSEAGLLLDGVDGPGLPRALVRVAALARTPNLLANALEEIACGAPPSQEEADGLLALALPLLLEGRAPRLEEPMETLVGCCSEVLQGLARGALGWWASGHRVPLDRVALALALDARALDEERERRRLALQTAVDLAWNIGFRFPLGEHTWEELRKPDGLLGLLKGFAAHGELAGARAWLEARDAEGATPATLMDRATDRVSRIKGDHIIPPKRTSCLARLDAAYKALRAWVSLAPVAQQEASWTVAHARELASVLGARRDDLARHAAERAPLQPVLSPLIRFIDDLSVTRRGA